MKLASFKRGSHATWGVATDDGLIDLGNVFGGAMPDLASVLAADALDQVREASAGESAQIGFDDVTFLPVFADSTRLVCVGRNYGTHVAEMGMELPETPNVFFKIPSALAAHEQEIVRPKVSTHFDFEAELTVVFGKTARHVAAADWRDVVAGYTILNDGSIRDWQKQNLMAGKNFPQTSGYGPFFVTADEIDDPQALRIMSRLNGETMQDDTTGNMIFKIDRLIEYVTGFTEMQPGDAISTGSPAGVAAGREPPTWMKAGDVIEVEIEGLGTLRNPVVDEA